jgi:hypothetical protein
MFSFHPGRLEKRSFFPGSSALNFLEKTVPYSGQFTHDPGQEIGIIPAGYNRGD